MAGRRYWLPKSVAMTRLGRPCRARPVLNPDRSIRNGRCRNHAGCSTDPKTAEGHARCLAGRLALYERRRAAGLPAIQRKPKNAQAAILEAVRLPPETPEAERARIVEDLRKRYPDRMEKLLEKLYLVLLGIALLITVAWILFLLRLRLRSARRPLQLQKTSARGCLIAGQGH
jgi:hypothetical protein